MTVIEPVFVILSEAKNLGPVVGQFEIRGSRSGYASALRLRDNAHGTAQEAAPRCPQLAKLIGDIATGRIEDREDGGKDVPA